MQSTHDAIKAYLPKSLHDMAEVISLDAVLKIIKKYGGTRLRIPKHAKPGHELYDLIGSAQFSKLCGAYSNEELDIPRCAKLQTLARDIQILHDSRARMSADEMAIKYGMTSRNIQKSLRRIEPHERKPWLKDVQTVIAAAL